MVTADELAFWRTKQIPVFRLPMSWDQIQPTVSGDLSSAYLNLLDGIVTSLAGSGGLLMPDIHGFGGGPGGIVGSAAVPISAFADLWSKICTWIQGKPSRIQVIDSIDFMNEWHGMSLTAPGQDIAGQDYTLAFQALSAASIASRTANFAGTHVFEGNHYSSPGLWPQLNSNWDQIPDPLNNKRYHAHMYPDRNSSGTHFSYDEEVAAAPGGDWPSFAIGTNPERGTNPLIGVQRLQPFVDWCTAKGVRGGVGEFGISNDYPNYQNARGTENFAAWNAVMRNTLDYCVANKVEVFLWSAGPEFASGYTGYQYNLLPVSEQDRRSPDYSINGVSSTQMRVIEDYTGFTGAQPRGYLLDKPRVISGIQPSGDIGSSAGFERPLSDATPGQPYGAPGSDGTAVYVPIRLRVNRKITSPIIITPRATYFDGSDAGGTFTPATRTAPVGENFVGDFTYSAAVQATLLMSATSGGALADVDPTVGYFAFSSILNAMADVSKPGDVGNVYALRRIVGSYIGPAIRLQRSSDGSQQDFYFNQRGDLPRQAIQNWAGGRSGISVIVVYDQSIHGNNATVLGSAPTLTLVNSEGYPVIRIVPGQKLTYNSAGVNQNNLSVLVRARGNNGNCILSADNYANNFRLTLTSFFTAPNGSPTTTVATGASTGVWEHLAGTWSNTYGTNNIKAYLNGSLNAQADTTNYQTPVGTFVVIGDARFGGQAFDGELTEIIEDFKEYSGSQVAAFAAEATTYYSTALPDALTAVNPTITGASAQNLVTGQSDSPFAGVTIADANASPSDTVTITLSGTTGTLSGAGLSGSGPWTLAADTPANVTTKLQALSFTTSASAGSTATLTMSVASSAGTSASNSATVLSIVAPYAPTISGTSAGLQAIGTHTAMPFGMVTVADLNTPAPSMTATITLTGGAGTLVSSGTAETTPVTISGSNPYTITAASAAAMTVALQTLLFQPSGGVGTVTHFALSITDSLGQTGSDSTTAVTVTAPFVETAYAAPTGTFTHVNFKGANLGDANYQYPAPDYAYLWPGTEEIDYLAAKGFGCIRLLMTQRRIQPAAYGPLDPQPRTQEMQPNNGKGINATTQMGQIKGIVDYCRSKNMYVIIDPHDYGHAPEDRVPGQGYRVRYMGSDPEGTKIVADWWARMAAKFQNYDNVIFGLMNEPQGQTAAQLQVACDAFIQTIRANGFNGLVLIPGVNSSSTYGWSANSGPPWVGYIGDPANNFAFEGHFYITTTGTDTNVCNVGTGHSALDDMTTWLQTNNFRGFVGEMGWGLDASCPPEAASFVGWMTSHQSSDVHSNTSGGWIGWTYWIGGTYNFHHTIPPTNIVPDGSLGSYVDKPQMSILTANL